MNLRENLEKFKKKKESRFILTKEDKKNSPKNFYTIGSEFLGALITSVCLAWALGHFLNLTGFWRIILGFGLAFALNALMIYKIIHK